VKPRCPRILVTPARDVTAATIFIRPAQRPQARTSSRNTRQISEAHGNLPDPGDLSVPCGAVGRSCDRDGSPADFDGTISDRPAKAGARTP
jgi:hypothetical protein